MRFRVVPGKTRDVSAAIVEAATRKLGIRGSLRFPFLSKLVTLVCRTLLRRDCDHAEKEPGKQTAAMFERRTTPDPT